MLNELFDEIAANIINTMSDDNEDYFIPDEFIQKFGETLIRESAAFLDTRKVGCRCYDDLQDDAGDELKKAWKVD